MKEIYIVLGARGYIGRKFVSYLQSQKKHVEALSRNTVDYTDTRGFSEYLNYQRPRWSGQDIIVINCAGKTGKPNVDQCEFRKAETIRANIMLPAMLSEVCYRQKITFCHVSSGCIYYGTSKRIFTEEDKPNFAFDNKQHSFYSGTKALAEEYVLQNPNSYIWRIRMPFDEYDSRRNYLSKLITYEKTIDATNSLTHIGDFIKCCHRMAEKKSPYGIYNMVNEGHITTREICEMISDKLEIKKTFDFFSSHKEFRKIVAAPRSNCVVSVDKFNDLPGVPKMRPVTKALADALDNWQ